jgi:hypothetical protein
VSVKFNAWDLRNHARAEPRHTSPPNLIARAKKSARLHDDLVDFIRVEPHVTVRSENLPEARMLLTASCMLSEVITVYVLLEVHEELFA